MIEVMLPIDGRNTVCHCCIYDPHDVVFQYGDVEVQEQTYRTLLQFEVGQNLRAMDRSQGLHSFDLYDFDLYDDAILDEHVDAVANVQAQPVVDERHSDLCFDSKLGNSQLHRQTRCIGRLEQAGAEPAMDAIWRCR
jgi:hypothetical protein